MFKELHGHRSEVNCLAFSPSGDLASGSDDATVVVWDLETEAPKQVQNSAAAAGRDRGEAWRP